MFRRKQFKKRYSLFLAKWWSLLFAKSCCHSSSCIINSNRTIKIQFVTPHRDKLSCPHSITPIVRSVQAFHCKESPAIRPTAWPRRIPLTTTHLADVSLATMHRFDVPRGTMRCSRCHWETHSLWAMSWHVLSPSARGWGLHSPFIMDDPHD